MAATCPLFSLMTAVRQDHSVINDDIEALYLEMINQKSKYNPITDSHLEVKKILKIILVNFLRKHIPR